MNKRIPAPSEHFDGLIDMQTWFENTIKPVSIGFDGNLLRWEGAFEEARRNHLARLVLIENGVPVTINTDDLLIFGSSVRKLNQAGCLTAVQLDTVRLEGLRSSEIRKE